MGNCQTADVAAVMIQHPDGRLERAYWSLPASDVMAANPGHYVAVLSLVVVPHRRSADPPPPGADHKTVTVRYLKLLRPEEPLLVGSFYRLVTFEDVLREFGSKKRVRLSKLLAKEEERRRRRSKAKAKAKEEDDDDGDHDGGNNTTSTTCSSTEVVEDDHGEIINSGGGIRMPRHVAWRPTLKTISEVGTC